jgi:DeoR/GlpR family transcriptional regulator of sugar metabolism
MVRIARQKILVADSSKFGKRSLSRIGALSEMSKVVTDTALPEQIQHDLRARGMEIIFA